MHLHIIQLLNTFLSLLLYFGDDDTYIIGTSQRLTCSKYKWGYHLGKINFSIQKDAKRSNEVSKWTITLYMGRNGVATNIAPSCKCTLCMLSKLAAQSPWWRPPQIHCKVWTAYWSDKLAGMGLLPLTCERLMPGHISSAPSRITTHFMRTAGWGHEVSDFKCSSWTSWHWCHKNTRGRYPFFFISSTFRIIECFKLYCCTRMAFLWHRLK